ncbi:Fur family transcriptional regulator [Jatrophihabitans sp. YIM 134969]
MSATAAAHDPFRAPAGRVRNTRQAAVIEDVLREQDGFRSAQQLHAAITTAGGKVGLTTVYRYLNTLADAGRADVVHNAEGEAQFRLCGEVAGVPYGDAGHHHHVVCRVCGRSVEVSGPEVEAWAERVAAAAGYTEVTHTLEVFGLCPEHSRRRGGSPDPG